MSCSTCKCNHQLAPDYNTLDTSTESLISHENKSILCTIRRSNVLLSFYVPFYIFYLVGGAFVFSVLESDVEAELRQSIMVGLQNFKTNHSCISDDELELFMKKVLEARGNGVSPLQNASSDSIWSFGQSLFFVSSIVTTIGYGSTHPLTQGGKLFCIAYAIIGIPLTYVLLAALTERLLNPAYWFQRKLALIYRNPLEESNIKILLLNLIIIGLMCGLFFFILPSFIFSGIEEGWDFLDAFYYCFISLTTIGLGDYTPGDNIDQPFRAIYKIGTTVYLLVGLTFMMLLFHLFNEIPQLNLGNFLLHTSDKDVNNEHEHLKRPSDPPLTLQYSQEN